MKNLSLDILFPGGTYSSSSSRGHFLLPLLVMLSLFLYFLRLLLYHPSSASYFFYFLDTLPLFFFLFPLTKGNPVLCNFCHHQIKCCITPFSSLLVMMPLAYYGWYVFNTFMRCVFWYHRQRVGGHESYTKIGVTWISENISPEGEE